MNVYIPLSMIRVMEHFLWQITQDERDRTKSHHFDIYDDDGTPVSIDIKKIGKKHIGVMKYRNQLITLTEKERILVQTIQRSKKTSIKGD